MTSNQKGNIGEAKAILYFTAEGYTVFTPLGVATPFDLIIYKDGLLKRVSVKSSCDKVKSGKYEVRLGQTVRRGELPFDSDSCDILFLYVLPEDRFVVIETKSFTNTKSITI